MRKDRTFWLIAGLMFTLSILTVVYEDHTKDVNMRAACTKYTKTLDEYVTCLERLRKIR